jgi:hypothetical protein
VLATLLTRAFDEAFFKPPTLGMPDGAATAITVAMTE